MMPIPSYLRQHITEDDDEGYEPSAWQRYLEENRAIRMRMMQHHPEIANQLKDLLGVSGCWAGIPSYEPPEISHAYDEPEPTIRNFDFADAFNYALKTRHIVAHSFNDKPDYKKAAKTYREIMA